MLDRQSDLLAASTEKALDDERDVEMALVGDSKAAAARVRRSRPRDLPA